MHWKQSHGFTSMFPPGMKWDVSSRGAGPRGGDPREERAGEPLEDGVAWPFTGAAWPVEQDTTNR